MKAAQMLASTDFHTITHAMNASVNLTLYDGLVYRAITTQKHRLLALIGAILCLN